MGKETFYVPEYVGQLHIVHATDTDGKFLVEAQPPVAAASVALRTQKTLSAKHPQDKGINYPSIVTGKLADGWLTIEFEEKPSCRLNDQGKAVNDILNECSVQQMQVAESIAAAYGYEPDSEDTDTLDRYFCFGEY